MNKVKKVIEKSLKEFDIAEDCSKDVFKHLACKSILSTTISNILSAIEEEVEEIESPAESEYDLESVHEGYFKALSDIQELLKSAKENIK